ncbi:MAG: HAMP domain-containing histidine kinase [Desulfatibacillum sp.]|nr:HAMP domain-containing histidine kinase [Desulfatibacillum sp.]
MSINRLRIIIILFCVALVAPSAYFIHHARLGMEQEERGALQFFADTILNYMEEDLARLVEREEGRAVDDYAATPGDGSGFALDSVEGFIVGYLQNNPDGSFTTPHGDNPTLVSQLESANQAFNALRMERRDVEETGPFAMLAEGKAMEKSLPEPKSPAPSPAPAAPQEKMQKTTDKKQGFVEKYLAPVVSRQSKEQLGQKGRRVEEISIEQAGNVANQELSPQDITAIKRKDQESNSTLAVEDSSLASEGSYTGGIVGFSSPDGENPIMSSPASNLLKAELDKATAIDELPEKSAARQAPKPDSLLLEDRFILPANQAPGKRELQLADPPSREQKLRVEVDPLQSMVLDHKRILLFRRIVLNNLVYNQGMVINTRAFLDQLNQVYFARQPMAQYSTLTLSVMDRGVETNTMTTGASRPGLVYRVERIFPRPFSFLVAQIQCHDLPKSAGRKTLAVMQAVFWFVVLAGLFAIYRSAAAVMDYSRRRNQFVSSVTHELKTPLTNIRMYVEMLEMGIARDTEREQEYLQVLGSESSRLSRLITNVLEFAKLENRKTSYDLQSGNLSEVLAEVRQVMGERLRSEGFVLEADTEAQRPFLYDREAMVQILVNLVENSVKFGKDAPNKTISIKLEQDLSQTVIRVSDKGPGIPKAALEKVFQDFFRVDNSLTRTTRGTGIGLALVRRFVGSMGGKVTAENNPGPGCTITIHLPT